MRRSGFIKRLGRFTFGSSYQSGIRALIFLCVAIALILAVITSYLTVVRTNDHDFSKYITITQLHHYEMCIDSFLESSNRLPYTMNELQDGTQFATYQASLNIGLKNDGWERPFLFEVAVKVISLGTDGIKGTSDDLVLQCTTSNASHLHNGESRDSESYGRRGIPWESASALKITNGIIDSECKVDIERFSNFYVHAAAEGGEISGNDEAELYLRGVRDPCELFVSGFKEMGMLTFPPGSFMRCDRANSKILIRNTAKNSEIIHRILADFTPGREHPLPEPFGSLQLE